MTGSEIECGGFEDMSFQNYNLPSLFFEGLFLSSCNGLKTWDSGFIAGPLGWRIVYPATNISRNFFNVSSCLQATKRHAAATSYHELSFEDEYRELKVTHTIE
jgi:hypothetical protein